MVAKVLLALAAVALTASLCQAAGIDIENAVVGKDLSGRKLMRNLMGDHEGGKDDYDWKKDDYPKHEPKHWKKDYPKYKAKTCYATSTYQKDPTTTSIEKVKKYYKKVTYQKEKKVTYTTYSYTYYDKVVKTPKYKTYVKYDVKTYDPEYKKYAVKYYQKKGWGEKWHIPKECQTKEPEEPEEYDEPEYDHYPKYEKEEKDYKEEYKPEHPKP